ncbi:IS21-like element helper ATPase IstB [Inconstantimicrobium porci]|uniref:AAA family ATPase n=1 Tax=Inconstantimicrobium porci TaxID=2652291 RepID=A0A7X2T2J0_9CLOT|nr:IS21-like element helper ATPase IstB [Inconstantimicrobium porci]MSR92717.1 AAA family ATPase [Inconstantimicrobium porci]
MKDHNRKIFLKGIHEYSEYLKLSTFKDSIESEIKSANETDISYEEFIYKLLQKEFDYKQEELRKSRIRRANFPYKKYLEELDVAELPEDAQKKLGILDTLDFIEKGQNVILSGNSGTGKTHIAIGLGIKACLSGYKVFFATVPLFITQLKELRSAKSLRAFQNKLERYDLVILDEFGYISSDKEGAELLFTNLSIRTGRKSTIITTNLSFDRWGEVFTDPVMAAAMTDRLTYKSYMVDMNGESYRLKATKKWMKEA